MEFGNKPSLATHAAFIVAVHLWYSADIWRLLNHDRRTLIREVQCKMSKLPAPNLIKRQIAHCVGPLGAYIFCWLHRQVYDREVPLDQVNLRKVICWTSQGTIDNKTTAQKILSTGILDRNSAFRLACFSCLEEEIVKLWSQHAYTCTSSPCASVEEVILSGEREEVTFWISYLSNKPENWVNFVSEGTRELAQLSAVGFESGIRNDNKEFVSLFLRKFYQTKDTEVMEDCAELFLSDLDMGRDPELFFLFLSLMDSKTIMKLIKKYPLNFLCNFMEWPLTHYFLGVAEQVYNFMNELDFIFALKVLASCISEFPANLCPRHIFEEFWNKSPDDLKKRVIYHCEHYLRTLLASARTDVKELANAYILQELCKQMFSNALIILDMSEDSCGWKILQTLILKYIPRTPVTLDFIEINYNKSQHYCGEFCSGNNFYEYIRNYFLSINFDSEDSFMDSDSLGSEDFSSDFEMDFIENF